MPSVRTASRKQPGHLHDDVPPDAIGRRSALAKARAWASGSRTLYQEVPTLVWSMTPEAMLETPPESCANSPLVCARVMGGAHLITFKPDPAPHWAGFSHAEYLLGFSCMQTGKRVEQIYPMVTQEDPDPSPADEARPDGRRRLRTRL